MGIDGRIATNVPFILDGNGRLIGYRDANGIDCDLPRAPGNARASNVYARKTLGTDKQASGTSTHQEQAAVPMGGMLVDMQIEVHNDSTSTTLTINDHAFAGGDTYGSYNPSGSWIVGATSQAVAATASAVRPNVFQTAKQRVYLPYGVNDPKWSAAYSRARFANGRIWGSNVASAYNSTALKHKSRLDFHAITNINDAFPNPPSGVDVNLRSSIMLITPVTAFSARTCAFIGDSRTRGQGSTSDERGWAALAVEAIASEFSDLIGYENWGISGTVSAQFLERFNVLMNNRTPDLIYYQPFSTNNANPFDEATITALMVTLANVADECRRRGVAFITSTQYASTAVDSAAKLAQFHRFNDHIRETYPGRYIEFYRSALTDRSGTFPSLALPYQADSQHCNDAGHYVGSQLAKSVIKRALGLSAVA